MAGALDETAEAIKEVLLKLPEIRETHINTNPTSLEQYDQLRRETDCYPVRHKTRGNALIITMTVNRDGWKQDIWSLEEMFSFLEVDTQYKFNLSHEETETVLKVFAGSEENRSVDVLFVVLMGHGGSKDYLQTADEKQFILRSQLPTIFSNDVYSLLVDRPKIFIAQMCRGVNENKGIKKEDGTIETDSNKTKDRHVGLFTDYLLGFATQPDTVSYRDTSEGSYYIQALTTEVINMVKDSQNFDIQHILVKVNDRLEKLGTDKVQISEQTVGLKRPLYLFPGLDMPAEMDIMKAGLTKVQKTLANYFMGPFSTIHLYSSDGETSAMVPLDEVYTHIKWYSHVQTCAANTQHTELENYKELFDKLCDTTGTRTIVTGVPGSGKTTFVKYLCNEWAKSKLEVCESQHLHRYILILPIKVRLIKNESTIEDIIMNQLPLKADDVKVIFHVLSREENIENILFVLDGWDESGILGALQPLLEKRLYPKAKIIITTRPHGIHNFRRIGQQREDQKAEIWGFTNQQIDKYIRRFFGDKYSEIGQPLVVYLTGNAHLLEMGRIPLNLEMMCHIWNKKKNLGDKLVDIYGDFVNCALQHFIKKPEWAEDLEGDSKDEKARNTREVLATLATKWNSKGTFHSSFNEGNLEKYFGSKSKIIKDLGYITKELRDGSDRWVFTHATMQDYFAACHFAEWADEQDCKDLVESCCSLVNLQQHKGMLSFLCGLSCDKSNAILKDIIRKYKTEEDCEKLLKIILHCLAECRNVGDQSLPLPEYVEINKETNFFILQTLFDTDITHRNLKHIAFKSFPKGKFPSLAYVQSLEVNMCNICSSGELEQVAHSLLSMKSLKSIDVRIKMCESCKEKRFEIEEKLNSLHADKVLHSQISLEQEKLHQNVLAADIVLKKYILESKLSCKKLEHVTVEGKGITRAIPHIIPKITKTSLEDLRVIEQDPNLEESSGDIIGELCKSVETKMSKLYLETEKLMSSVHLLKTVPLFLTVRAATNEDLDKFVKTCLGDEPPSIQELSLTGVQKLPVQETSSGNIEQPSSGEGGPPDSAENLASVLCMLPNLQKVKFEQCGITKDTLNAINESIKTKVGNCRLPIKELSLNSNELSKAGCGLGNLINHSELDTLSICDSGLGGFDVEELAKTIPDYTTLRKLHLENNPLAQECGSLSHLLKNVPNLEVLEIIGCDVTGRGVQELTDVLQDDDDDGMEKNKEVMNKLRILNLGYNNFSKGGLIELGHFINIFLPELQALCVPYCRCEDVDDLAKLITRLPSKVEYLDVSKNLYKSKIVSLCSREVTCKEQLCQLRKLNIGQRDNDSERGEIQTNLVQMHQTLKSGAITDVYYANQEDLCIKESILSVIHHK